MERAVARCRPGEPLGDFLQRADEALYRAKREGRNRVITEFQNLAEADRAG